MSASVYGSATYGTADETGVSGGEVNIYTSSVSLSVNQDEALALGSNGEVVAAAFFNESAELTLEGVLQDADNPLENESIAGVLEAGDLANSDIFGNGNTGCTVFYIRSIGLTREQAGFQSGNVSCMSWLNLNSTSAVTV